MHLNVFYDNRVMPSGEALIRGVSSAVLYGKGVFSTIAIYDKQPFLREKHWKRLEKNAERLGIDISDYPKSRLNDALDEIIAANECEIGRARLTLFDEASSSIWNFDGDGKASLLIITADFRCRSENLRLTVSPCLINSTSPLAGIKSCNYLEKIVALGEAKTRGFDEAVQLNERGEITSACMANVFWRHEGKLYTPGLKTGCLAGTTREFVLENCECAEIETGIEALRKADSVFLTSAGIGVVQAAEFDGRKLNCEPHEILKILPKRS